VELPMDRKKRFMEQYQLPENDAEVFISDVPLGDYFEKVASHGGNPKALANWVINNLRAQLVEPAVSLDSLRFEPAALVELVELVDTGKISSKIAQSVFTDMFTSGKAPAAIVAEKGLVQVSDTGAIEQFCDQAIEANPGPAEDYRQGKDAALNFLKGQVMKLSRGKANPALVGKVLDQKLRP